MAFSGVSTNSEDEFKGFSCYWRIENFCWDRGDPAFDISSPKFKIHTLQSNWFIIIKEFQDGLGVFLEKLTKNASDTLGTTISVLTDSGRYTILAKFKSEFTAGYQGSWGSKICTWSQLRSRDKLYFRNGALTIFFNVRNCQLDNENSLCLIVSRMTRNYYLQERIIETFSTLKTNGLLPFPPMFQFPVHERLKLEERDPKELKDQLTQTDANNDSKDVSQTASNIDFKDMADLLRLFKEKEFSFVTLRTANRDFSVHKAVLCSKSPVFSAMFDKEMKENKSNLVYIDDIDSETMAAFVSFLHLEPLGNLRWENAIKLYYAADKYQIDALKKESTFLLEKELSVENVCDVFILADLHQDKELMSCAQDFFCKNSKTIFPSKKWKDLVLSHPELITEILCKLSEKL